jgi:hypothetical protein
MSDCGLRKAALECLELTKSDFERKPHSISALESLGLTNGISEERISEQKGRIRIPEESKSFRNPKSDFRNRNIFPR